MASITSDLGEKKDLISGLPDDLLSHIFSLLPLKDAIKSTLLLKRFRNLWRSFSKLALCTWPLNWDDRSHSDDEKLAKLIHHILIYHEKKIIDEFRLWHCFFFRYSKNPRYSINTSPEIQLRILEEKRFAGVIDSFVTFAIIKRCKVLTLFFVSTKEEGGDDELHQGYILPTIVYRSVYLTRLTVGACDITSCDEVYLKLLKFLRFMRVVMSDEAMQKFMLGCPSLEHLSIDDCYGLHNLCCSNVKLNILRINHTKQYSLTVSNLNVEFLKINGISLDRVVVLKSDVLDAEVISRQMTQENEMRSYDGFKFLLRSLDQCKTFRSCPWSLEVLAIWELTSIPCPYFKWKHLVLDRLWLTSCVQVGLSTVLRHVPLLRTLEMYIRPRPGAEDTTYHRSWLQEYELDDEEKYWIEAKANLENLQIVLIDCPCITEEPAVIHVAKFLLRNAVALEKIVVSTNNVDLFYYRSHNIFTNCGIKPEKDGILTDELTCIMENLVASPKASTKAKIYFE